MDETHKVTALLTLSQEKILSNHVSRLTKTMDKGISVLERLRDPLQFFLISLSCCFIGGTLAGMFTLSRVARSGEMMGVGGMTGRKKRENKDGKKERKEGKDIKDDQDDKLSAATMSSTSRSDDNICVNLLVHAECTKEGCKCLHDGAEFEAAWRKQRVMSDKLGNERSYFKHSK